MQMSSINQAGVEQWLPKNAVHDSPFITYAKNFHPLSQQAQIFANQRTFTCRIRKGELLLAAGEMCTSIYLVRHGIFRSYVKHGAKEITTWITAENDLVTSISSFGLLQPAKENIQAIEDGELIGLRFEDLEYMYEAFPEMNMVGRKILERYYRLAEERAFVARLTEATIKYKHYAATNKELLTRVPLKFIASYLGMTLETLSRIRSKLSRLV
jgi:CRP-like cAMP-binding protein